MTLTGIPGETLWPSITFYDSAEAAAFLKVSTKTLARWRVEGTGPAWSKPGSRVYYKLTDLVSYAERKAA